MLLMLFIMIYNCDDYYINIYAFQIVGVLDLFLKLNKNKYWFSLLLEYSF